MTTLAENPRGPDDDSDKRSSTTEDPYQRHKRSPKHILRSLAGVFGRKNRSDDELPIVQARKAEREAGQAEREAQRLQGEAEKRARDVAEAQERESQAQQDVAVVQAKADIIGDTLQRTHTDALNEQVRHGDALINEADAAIAAAQSITEAADTGIGAIDATRAAQRAEAEYNRSRNALEAAANVSDVKAGIEQDAQDLLGIRESALRDIESALPAAEQAYAQKRAQREAAEQAYTQAQEAVEQAEQQVDRIQAEADEAQIRLEAMESSVGDEEARVEALDSDRRAITQAERLQTEAVAKAADALSQAETRLKTAKEAVDRLESTNSKISKEVSAKREAADQAVLQAEDAEENAADELFDLEDVETQLEAAQSDLTLLESRVHEAQALLGSASDRTRERRQGRVDELTGKLEEGRSKVDGLAARKDQIEQSLEDAKVADQTAKKLTAEVGYQNLAARWSGEQTAKKREEIQQLEDEVAARKKLIAEAQAIQQDIAQELQRAITAHEEGTASLTRLRGDIDQTRQDIATLEQRLTDATQAIETKTQALDETEMQLTEARRQEAVAESGARQVRLALDWEQKATGIAESVLKGVKTAAQQAREQEGAIAQTTAEAFVARTEQNERTREATAQALGAEARADERVDQSVASRESTDTTRAELDNTDRFNDEAHQVLDNAARKLNEVGGRLDDASAQRAEFQVRYSDAAAAEASQSVNAAEARQRAAEWQDVVVQVREDAEDATFEMGEVADDLDAIRRQEEALKARLDRAKELQGSARRNTDRRATRVTQIEQELREITQQREALDSKRATLQHTIDQAAEPSSIVTKIRNLFSRKR